MGAACHRATCSPFTGTGAAPLPGFLHAVAPYLDRYGYGAVALLVTLEDFGVPVPGETVVIAAALYAGAGRLNILAVGLVAVAAAVFGDNIGFAIGHFGGRTLALRLGRYVFLTSERLDKAEAFFDRHGGRIIVAVRPSFCSITSRPFTDCKTQPEWS